MCAKLKVAGIVIILISITASIFFVDHRAITSIIPTFVNDSESRVKTANYTSHIALDQKDLKLDHEVIQFKIIFHEKDTINVSVQLAIEEMFREPTACLMMITNGSTSIFGNTTVLSFSYLPTGTIVDTTIFHYRFIFGGKLFHKLLSFTRFRIGQAVKLSKNVQVQSGDVWFLTMVELNSKLGEELKVAFRSLMSFSSMELVQLNRSSNLGFFSSLDNDFEGIYMGFKIPFLPFGFSIAHNLHKEVILLKGGLINFASVGHRKGKITVEMPNGKIYTNPNKMVAIFSYCGNQTGTWKFSASGWGFPWKHVVVLFYIDVDPHIKSMV